MVQSKAETVDAFMADVQPERAAVLVRLRQECIARFPGWEERMQWGMPGYGPPGADARISFNNQKNYISLYAGKTAIDAHRDRLKGANFGGGCVRFANPDRIDFAIVGAMLDDAFRARSGDK